ncbi:MAG: hypothetical protein KY394_02960 [Actinobacteria bacterium]|nr:hypothetical protein [Actinomycetota bacterium]
MLAAALSLLASACGDAPLGSVGDRSSEWINEPEVSTTTTVPVTIPVVISSDNLAWSNDDIVNDNLGDPGATVAAVFARREGDRFIQASRAEITVALPGIGFPANVPNGARWVSSQLVIEATGEVADDPSAAFGIWSAEPYTRSRSVAQMAVLRVALDPETIAELAAATEPPSCARFSDRNTDNCEIVDIGGRTIWRLQGSGGTTLIWFDDTYRYELFGRDYLQEEALLGMAEVMIPLAQLEPVES